MKTFKPKPLHTLLALLLAFLAACGSGGTAPEPSTPNELAELIVNGDQADAEVGLQVLRSFKPATVTTQFNPEIGGQTIYEVAGTTPKGKAFKAVMLGDEGLNLNNFKGQMRMQARLRKVQGQAVLAGRFIPKNAESGLNPIAFVAGGENVVFKGPAAGSVYQLSGNAEFKGTCAEDGLAGAYSFKQGAVELGGALTGVRERNKALGCTPGAVEGQLPVALSYTAVQTHMGIIFSTQGSLVSGVGASRVGSQAAGSMPSQGVAVPSNPLADSTIRATSTLKSNVKELGNRSGAELVSFDPVSGTMIFNRLTGSLDGLAREDIITSAPRTAAPNGFLRKVVHIQNTNDGKIEVDTAKVNVADLLDEADISVDQAFSAADVQRASALEGGKVIYAASQMGPSAQALITDSFDLVLYDQDDNRSTTDDQVKISGNFEVNPRVVIKFECRRAFCSDPYFLGKFVLDQEANITVSAKLKKELRESKQIVRIPLPAITAGPLVFVPDIVVSVDLEGVIRVELEVGATQNLHIEAGVEYVNGSFNKINVVDTDVGITGPTVEGSVEVKAGIYAALRLMLYGVAGVSAEAGPYAKFEAQYPRQPYWSMKYGIEGNLGVDIDLIIFAKEWDVKLFDKVFNDKTKEAPNQRPKFLEIGPKYLCDDGYTARGLAPIGGGLANITLFALTDDDEDGAGTGTIEWRSSRDGLLGTTRKADKHTINFPLRNGNPHTITAVLTDSQGGTRTREFEVKLANDKCQFPGGFPNVDITSDDNALLVVVGTDGSLTLKARTNIGLSPICSSEVKWKSNLENRNAGTSTGVLETIAENGLVRPVCTHTFANVYKNLSPQTITAKFTHNNMTVTDSIEVGALIPLTLILGNIEFDAPSRNRYIYEGDQVSFEASGSNLVWSSSVESDNINGKTGNNVNGRFNTIGPRTIVARSSNSNSSFASKSVTINVLSALAKP